MGAGLVPASIFWATARVAPTIKEGSNIYVILAFWLIILILLCLAIHALWSRHIHSRALSFFLLPGAIIHELSHALLCLVTGATIKELSIARIENPGIKYEKPKVPVIGDFLIAFAPIAGCAVVLSIVFVLLNTRIDANVPLSENVRWILVKYLYGFKETVFLTVYNFWVYQDLGNAKLICSLLATVIFTLSIAPHKGDIKYLVPGIIIVAAILYSLDAIGLSLSNYKWLNYSVYKLWNFTIAGLCTLAGFLLLTFIIITVAKGIKLVSGK